MTIDPLARALTLNRDKVTAGLTFRPPFLPLLDRLHCATWEAELAERAQRWEVRRATPDLWQMLPNAAGLYMFVWRPPFAFEMAKNGSKEAFGWVLYVGLTGADDSKNTFKERYKREYSRYLEGDPSALFMNEPISKREQLLRRYLLLEPLEYWYAEVEDSTIIGKLEQQLIRTFSPPLNQHHALLTKRKTRPAF